MTARASAEEVAPFPSGRFALPGAYRFAALLLPVKIPKSKAFAMAW